MSFDFSLREALAAEIFGNAISVWLVALSVFAAVFAAMLLARYVVTVRLARMAERTQTAFDDLVVDVFRRTRPFHLLVLSLAGAALLLELPETIRQAIRYAAVVAIALQVGRWGNGIISFWVKRFTAGRPGVDGASSTSMTALGYVARGVLWMLLLLLAMDNLGINITALVTGLGIGGIAVALAVQNILGDLFAAMSIVIDKPFVVGDAIVVDTWEGTVERIGVKSTRLRSPGGEQIIVANADLLRSRIRNFQRLVERRAVLRIAVAQRTAPELVERIPAMVREIVSAQEQVRFDRAHFSRIGEYSLEFEAVYFVVSNDYGLFMNTQQSINLAILRRFRSESIELALPARELVQRVEAAAAGVS